MTENKNQGWIKVHRTITDHWTFNEPRKFSKFEAWIDLLLMVNHADNKFLLGNELVEVKRGQKITSIRKLCDRWQWSNNKVKKFLEMLELDGMIIVKSDTKKTVLTVVNYDFYQDIKKEKHHESDTDASRKHHESDTDASRTHTNKNDLKNDKNDKNDKEINNTAKPYIEIIDYLNQKTNKNFKSNSKATQRLVDARLNEGYGIEDFKKVIDIKVSQWIGNVDMNRFLRPQTLFSPKFESYLNEKINIGYQSAYAESQFIPPDENNLPF